MAVVAWWIPARWRSLHPAVVRIAGQGTPGVVDLAVLAANQQRSGLSLRLLEAAVALGLPGTNEAADALEAATVLRPVAPEVRALGGPDPAVAALLPSFGNGIGEQGPTALELFLPASRRVSVRNGLLASRSPGVQVLLKTLELPVEQFVPAGQPGGQPFEAVVLISSTLYERERFHASLVLELRELASAAPDDAGSRRRLEEFYLGVLSLARRLDWTSLAELVRKVPSIADFERFAAAVRSSPGELPVLYASALMSGEPAGVGHQWMAFGDEGRRSVGEALGAGAGAIRMVARDARPVRRGLPAPTALAREVQRAPESWLLARSSLFVASAFLAALGLAALARAGLPRPAVDLASWAWASVVALVLGGFLILASEPMPGRPAPPPASKIFIELRSLTGAGPVKDSSPTKRNLMEPTTLATLVVFAAIQMTVYVICLRKVGEICRRPEPAAIRLRLLENEENLFDTGLYVGIGGTAAALVMQVLQLVEANLLAAYSSNLMGIVCVAVVKIGHVRKARRLLILETQAEIPSSVAPVAAGPAVAPAPVTASNPFTFR